MGESECFLCFTKFKTLTIRTTKKKHHCRTCGRVVCHVCSSNRCFLEKSQTYERVCNSCVERGPPEECLVHDTAERQKKALQSYSKHVVSKLVGGKDGDEEGSSSSEEEEEAAAGGGDKKEASKEIAAPSSPSEK